MIFPFLLLGFATLQGFSALSGTQVISPQHDAYIDLNNPNTNYDPCASNSGGLDLGYSAFPSFLSTREIYLKFDLSGISESANRSLFSVTITNNVWEPGSTLSVSLYGIPTDGWDETIITWNNKPTGSPILLETQQIAAGYESALTFGDPASANPVGTFIEDERTNDGHVTFLIKLTGGSDVQFAGLSTIEDRESCLTPTSGDEPTIQIRSDQTPNFALHLPIVIKGAP